MKLRYVGRGKLVDGVMEALKSAGCVNAGIWRGRSADKWLCIGPSAPPLIVEFDHIEDGVVVEILAQDDLGKWTRKVHYRTRAAVDFGSLFHRSKWKRVREKNPK